MSRHSTCEPASGCGAGARFRAQGEYGAGTWEAGAWQRVGHTNVWAPFTVDTARGMVFLPVSTPSNDYYGGAAQG